MEKRQITEEVSVINLQRDEISEYRARWYNDGEKKQNTSRLNLEKRHLKQKTIKSLHLSDNEEILKEAKSFYQKLYSSIDNQCDEIFFPLGNIVTLTEREQNECG